MRRCCGQRLPRRRRVPADEPADSLKSAIPCPGRFHRFQRIQTDRFTLSTAALYDLYTRYGQSVDKKALLPCLRNYPQVPPQAGRPIYRGFQVHKFLLNQSDKVFFHEIWLYHHHHALDLYPDLEARLAPICIESSLWTAAFAEGSPSRRDAGSSVPVWPDLGTGDEYRILHLDFDQSRLVIATIQRSCFQRSRRTSRKGNGFQPSPSTEVTSSGELRLLDAPRGTCKKNAREDPGRRSVPRGTAAVRDAAASPRGATSRCWIHAPVPRSWNRAAG